MPQKPLTSSPREWGFQALVHLWGGVQQLRFTVHRLPYWAASPCSHGPSVRGASSKGDTIPDVECGVDVGVGSATTRRAAEQSLALAAVPIHGFAVEALLRRVRGIYMEYSVGSLFFKALAEQAPPGAENAAVQGGLRFDIRARSIRGASGRAGHRFDRQFLDDDEVEVAGDHSADSFDPVFAPVALACRQAGDHVLKPSAASRTLLAPGKTSLQTNQPFGFGRGVAWCVQKSAIGQGGRHGHATVDADDFAVARRRDGFGDRGESDMPAARSIPGHPIRLHSGNGAGPAETDPAELRDLHLADLAGQSPDFLRIWADDTEALVDTCLAPGRLAFFSLKVSRPRLVVVPQCLLLDDGRTVSQPRILGPGLGELPRLHLKARRHVASAAPPRILFHCEVPHISRMSAMLFQRRHLRRRRIETEPGHVGDMSRDDAGGAGKPVKTTHLSEAVGR